MFFGIPFLKFASQKRFYCTATINLLAELKTIAPTDYRKTGKHALILMAHGTEEMDSIIMADMLRRAGIDVIISGLKGFDLIKCSRRTLIKPDVSLEFSTRNIYKFNLVYLPGGPEGVRLMGTNSLVATRIKEQLKQGALLATSGGAILILAGQGILLEKNVATHPMLKGAVKRFYNYVDANLVVDDPLYTCRSGPYVYQMALLIIEKLVSVEVAQKVANLLYIKFKPSGKGESKKVILPDISRW